MKTQNQLRKSLGLTQQDMAILLGVSRSQLAYYELGRRELPLSSLQKLNELTILLNQLDSKDKRTIDDFANVPGFKKILSLNEYQQCIVDRKIAAAETKYAALSALSNLLKPFSDGNFQVSLDKNQTAYLISEPRIAKMREQLALLYFGKQRLAHDHAFLLSMQKVG